MAESIKDIIESWHVSLGMRVPIREARMQPLLDLFATFASNGYTRQDIDTVSVKNMIVKTCVHENAKNKSKPGWVNAVEKDIKVALYTQWPVETVKSDKTPVAVPKIEIAPKIEKEEKEEEKINLEAIAAKIMEDSFIRTTVDPDPDYLRNFPEPDVEYYTDEEFMKLLRGGK